MLDLLAEIGGVFLDGSGDAEASALQGVHVFVADFRDVEVAEHDVAGLFGGGAVREVGPDGFDLGLPAFAVGFVFLSVENVDGGKVELEPSGLEGDAERRARELHALDQLGVGEYDLSGDVLEADLVGVVQECDAFAVAAVSRVGHVGGDVVPVLSQDALHPLQSPHLLLDFLDCDKVETAEDLSDVHVALLLAVVGELADVPGGQEQGVFGALLRNLLVELLAQQDEVLDRALPLSQVFDVFQVGVKHSG